MATSTERMRALRARRAAAIEPADPDAGPGPMALAVEAALDGLPLTAADAAAAELARRTARAIDAAADAGWAMRWLGPELLRVLAALGATPSARSKAAPRGAAPAPRPPSRVAELRLAHQASKSRRGVA